MRKPTIAVFGANPAWQKSGFFSRLTPGEVNRMVKLEAYAAGKGVNFCRAAACLGRCETELFQFSGGENGRRHRAALAVEGLRCTAIETVAETRCCLTCLDRGSGTMTELIEPSFPVTAAEAERMLAAFAEGLRTADGAAITGSLPDGTDPALYSAVAQLARQRGVPLLIDAVAGIRPVLDACPEVILKINASELQRLTNCTDLVSALTAASTRWPSALLAITDGAADAFLMERGRGYRFRLPEVTVVSPLGAGDTCAAVLLSELLGGLAAPEAFALALAAASANCLTPRAGQFDPALLPELSVDFS